MVRVCASIAQVFDEFLVAVDVGVDVAKLPKQRAPGLGVARVEFPYFGGEQVIEEERAVFGALLGRRVRVKPAPLLGFLAGQKSPADGLGVSENAGLDGFMFGGGGHIKAILSCNQDHMRNLLLICANCPVESKSRHWDRIRESPKGRVVEIAENEVAKGQGGYRRAHRNTAILILAKRQVRIGMIYVNVAFLVCAEVESNRKRNDIVRDNIRVNIFIV